jgi:transposase
VVIVDAAKPDVRLQSRRFGTGAAELNHLLAWRMHYEVREAVMESTAQYWKPVWMELEPHLRLHLAQAQSNRAPRGRKSDLADVKRLLRRFAAGELMLSFIPEPEQRAWRMVTRGRPALVDALAGSMGAIHCQLLAQHLDRVELIDRQMQQLNQLAAAQMQIYQEAVTRLIEVPGIGAQAAQEILAEIGPQAAAFPSAEQLASWIGVGPGSDESAGENHSGRSAKGNRFLRRLLCQAAQAAARTKQSQLESVLKRLVVRLGYVKAVWAIAHRLCKIVWNILHKGARFIEFSQARNPKAIQRAIRHHLKALRRLGYQIPDSPAALAPTNG